MINLFKFRGRNSGSYLNLDSKFRLVRSDLIIDVDTEFWNEFKIINAKDLYIELNKKNNVYIIFAGADQVLGKQKSPAEIPSCAILETDHDFKNRYRDKLIDILRTRLHLKSV